MAAQQSPAQTTDSDSTRSRWTQAALLILILLAFARVTWSLGEQDFWWDESLSLQRAESGLIQLLKNEIVLADGTKQVATTDQHPFFFFLLQNILLHIAGDDEFVLRFVSDAATTLMVPVAYVFAALYVRRKVLPSTAPVWAALMVAVSPFLLWYGQEARPYALWALLALLSTYLLLRTTARPLQQTVRWPWLAGYIGTLLMFVATHYYAVFLLPIHAVLIYRAMRNRYRKASVVFAIGFVAAGILIVALAFWLIVLRQDGGGNFRHISWKILLPDVLNAYSLGLSVDISRVFYLDLLFGLIALAGTIYALRSKTTWNVDGWAPVAMVVIPIMAILVADQVHPVYMNARHLGLIVGPFIVLVAAGLGLSWMLRPWIAVILALILVAGSGYSTVNYFTKEEYAKEDYSRLGAELDNRLAAGDLVLVKSPFAWRVFSYYLPEATMNGMPGDNDEIDVYGTPLLEQSWEESSAFLEDITSDHQRIWLLVSNTHPYMDPENRVEDWLVTNMFKVQETTYFSHSSLKAHQYLSEVPVYETIPDTLQNPVDIVFGDQIRLHGYDITRPPESALALPLTLYWEAVQPTDRHYKYAVRLVELADDGSLRTISQTEREPYMGAVPTIYWDPGKIIAEYTELPPGEWPQRLSVEEFDRYRLALEVYDAETLEKLPITVSGDAEIAEDGVTIILPYRPQ